MRLRYSWCVGLVLLGCVAHPTSAPAPVPAATPSRGMTEQDLLRFRWVADPQISPDGALAAYTLVQVDSAKDRYQTSIWVVATDGHGTPRPLAAGPFDATPRWAPDGRTLAFVRRGAGDTGTTQIFVVSRDGGGGEPRPITHLARSVTHPAWSPDGRSIAFTTDLRSDDSIPVAKRIPKKSDVHVITRSVYRDNDQGWLDETRHDHIWVVAVAGGAAPRALTSGNYDEENPVWSHDGTRVLYTSQRVDDPSYSDPDDDVYAVPAAGGASEKVIDITGPIRAVAGSPDGQAMAFVGYINPAHRQSYTQSAVFIARGTAVEQVTHGGDAEIGSSVTGDQHPPRGGSSSSPLIWSADGRSLIVATTEHGRSNLAHIDLATRRIEPLTTGAHDIVAYTATPDASRFALTISDVDHVGDLYAFVPATGTLTQLTHVNDALWGEVKLGLTERITYRSFDGQTIEMWLTKPPGFDPAKKYPLILNIHGGPHAAYGETFVHEFQVMAARGYVVLAPNPRGSTTYGESFGNVIQYHYPGDDYKDLMIGVDTVVGRGYIDAARLGVTGGSGGGLLTNWTVTQTSRFRAAVSQRSIADWAAWWYTADFTLFQPAWFREPPFRDPQDYAARSPITYVDKVTTPLMLIEGESDSRTPSGSGGMTMFRALKALHKTTEMVVFPGETHELSRSGKPSHRIERLQQILRWMDTYLNQPGAAASTAAPSAAGTGE